MIPRSQLPKKPIPHPHHFRVQPDFEWICHNAFCTTPEETGWFPWAPFDPNPDERQANALTQIAEETIQGLLPSMKHVPNINPLILAVQKRLLQHAKKLKDGTKTPRTP